MRLLGGACCVPVAEFLKIFADSRAARGGHQPPPAPLLRRRPFFASARQRCVWGSASTHPRRPTDPRRTTGGGMVDVAISPLRSRL
jgi:hypothetical protein